MAEGTSTRLNWQNLIFWAPLAVAASFVLVMVIVGEVVPEIIIFGTIIVIIGFVGRRFPRRAGPITVIVGSALLVLLNLQFIVEDLAHPESVIGFMSSVAPVVFAILGIVAGAAVLRSASGERAPTALYAALGVVVIALVVGVVAASGLEDDTFAVGDLRIVAEDVEFSPEAISGTGGSIGVFIENNDPFRHTFAIEALDIEVELPAKTAVRVEISAPAAEYVFICTVPGHEKKMTGTLTING